MEVGLLGPLEVAGPAGQVQIGGAKERLVLALLALRTDQVVPRDALVDAVWGDDPPATAVKTLQGYVARVRRALEGAGLADLLGTRAPGYVLHVPADAIDITGFERDAAAGRRALVAGDASQATALLREALARWRGDALVDCRGGGWAETEALRLDERRLTTVEDQIDADLMLGHHGMLVGELESLVARHPLRERLWAALMLALYRAGRQADALRTYQRARDVLVGDLGLEPGNELRELEAAILAGDPDLDAPVPAERGPITAIPLPARVVAASPTVLVGRASERARLDHSLQAVNAGERRVALISGEPGIGKTTLSAAFAQTAFERGAVVLYGRCDEDLGIPYQPWSEVLTHLVSHAPEGLLGEHVDARGSELTRLAPELTRFATDVRTSPSDAESDRYLLFGAAVDLFARISTVAPVVLVLDDLHWADPPTLQLLRHVASADAALRLFMIGTFRDSDVGPDHPLADVLAALHRESGVERLALRGLGRDELLTLVETAIPDTTPGIIVALRDALAIETDGNPFFVGEMLRHLSETGSIVLDEHGHWSTGSDLRTSGLPISLREVIGRRVARLGRPTQGALSLASVIGRDFDTDVLARVADLSVDTVIDLCDQAVAAALLTESEVAGRYAFAHALIGRALYDDLSSARRGSTHRKVAEALEALWGDEPGDRIGELARHWAHATHPPDASRAIAYAQRAGDHALAQLAPDDAMRWYRDALDLLDRSSTDDPHRRAELLLGLGDAQRQTGDPEHRDTLLAACRLADGIDAIDLLVCATLRNNRGWNSVAGGVDHERVEMQKRALDRLGDADSPDRARLLALLCVETTWAADFDERLSMATQAVGIARRTGDDAALVDSIRLCHESITMPPTLDLRVRWNAEACDLAAELGDPTASVHANDWRWLSALEAGDVTTMRAARAIFSVESERIGQPLNHWQIAYHWVVQHMIDGDLDGAERSATEALALGTAAGHAEDAMRFHRIQLLTLRWLQGRASEMAALIPPAHHHRPGNQIFPAALASAKSLDDSHHEATDLLETELANGFEIFADALWLVVLVFWADAAARTGHRRASTVLYQRLLPWHDQFATSHITVHGAVAHSLGRLAHALDLHDEADDWFGQALACHQGLEAPFFVAMTEVARADLLAARDSRGDDRRARDLAGSAAIVASDRGYLQIQRDARSVLTRIT